MLKEYLKDNYIITDGATGTYYSTLADNSEDFCEMANINSPMIIKRIHKEYIASGAMLIRTNTFSANTRVLNISKDVLKEVIQRGYEIAKESSEGGVYVAANIGPIPEVKKQFENEEYNATLEEYKFIVDAFVKKGADVFIFETFSSLKYLKDVASYIKKRNNKAFILTQFALMQDGYTRKGISAQSIKNEISDIRDIDAFGFNCGLGPTHLLNIVKKLDISGRLVSALPNSGYPEIVNERTMFNYNPEYFSKIMMDFVNLGVKIIGGCCGTTPEHIKRLSSIIGANKAESHENDFVKVTRTEKKVKPIENKFMDKLEAGKFVYAVELDPPMDTDIQKVMKGAKVLKDFGVDLNTIAEYPMSKVRIDSVAVASKIKREIGIDTMPHICCRDKNTNAIKSGLLAANIEEIRNILAVTGDTISGKDNTKSVFNLNSFQLIELIRELNKDLFSSSPFYVGGAVNLSATRVDVEIKRMEKKYEKGARFFLTQPIFSDHAIDLMLEIKKMGKYKLIGGIMPIVTYRNAQFLNNEVPGINVPKTIIDRFKEDMTREEAEVVGIETAVELALKIKPYVNGLYIMTPFNSYNMVVEIIRQIREA